MQALAQVPGRHAVFDEEKHLAALTVTLHSRGTLLYRRPDFLQKTTTDPQPETLIIRGGYLDITAGNDAPHVVDLASQPGLNTMIDALRAPLAGDLVRLRQHFQMNSTGNFADWQMTLVPTDPDAAKFLHQVVLRGHTDAITEIDIQQANGDDQIMHIQAQP